MVKITPGTPAFIEGVILSVLFGEFISWYVADALKETMQVFANV